MSPRQFRASIARESRRALPQIVAVLNNSTHLAHAKLLQLVTAWQASGPNLQQVCASDPELNHMLRTAIRVGYRPSASGGADLELMPDLYADPRDYGEMLKRYYHRRSPDEAKAILRADSEAYLLFLSLTLNPEWEKLGGPCSRCGKYYLKRRANQKTYCSRTCASFATVTQLRTQEHERLLQQARNAIRQWTRASGMDWKEFVCRKTGLTSKWLTRAVNRGELATP